MYISTHPLIATSTIPSIVHVVYHPLFSSDKQTQTFITLLCSSLTLLESHRNRYNGSKSTAAASYETTLLHDTQYKSHTQTCCSNSTPAPRRSAHMSPSHLCEGPMAESDRRTGKTLSSQDYETILKDTSPNVACSPAPPRFLLR